MFFQVLVACHKVNVFSCASVRLCTVKARSLAIPE